MNVDFPVLSFGVVLIFDIEAIPGFKATESFEFDSISGEVWLEGLDYFDLCDQR